MTPERKGGHLSARFAVGLALLDVAFLASMLLVLDALGAMDAPGCGAASPCHAAASSAFGRLPGLSWPLSYAGCAWFAGLIAGWVATRGAVSGIWVWLARAGAAGSVFWLGVMAAKGFACPYCLAIHVANLAFVAWIELGRERGAASARRALIATGAVALAVTGVLVVLDRAFADAAREQAERELAASSAAVRSGAAPAAGFVGRHRRGPEGAVARLVVLTDFQCPECRELEGRLEALLARNADVSLAIRHYPLCSACNPKAPDIHPNACWAARAAEAAGMIAGEDGYWRMHRWLFARGGSFTGAELDAGLVELKFDRAGFLAAMHSDATLARVREDVRIGDGVGLTTTPMIFVNGVELRGWHAPDALDRALAAARAAPQSASATADRPPSASERYLDLWRTAPISTLPVDTAPHVVGPESAKVRVLLFGDYQEPFTCEADGVLREIALRRGDVSYAFRAFPVNRACNPVAEVDMHPLACLAAMGAEAAGVLQGEDGFWAMHDWLVVNRATFDDGALTRHAEELGLDRDVFWKAMTTPELPLRIEEDARAAKWLGVTSIPLVFVNEKRVAVWKAGNENLLPAIVVEAAGR